MLEDRIVLSAAPLVDFSQLAVDTTHYNSSQILVRFRDEQLSADSESIFTGTKLGQKYSLVPGLHEITLQEGTSVDAALAAYRDHPSVLYAEPDYQVQLLALPNDPSFSSLWGLNNTGQTGGTASADINAPEAWDAFAAPGGEPVIVAVIDTGVDYTHPDLANRMWTNSGEIAGDGIDNDNNGIIDDIFGADFVNNDGDPMDDNLHGTHVAGTIAAQFNNGVGVAGVAGPANVEIMALKFLSGSGSGSTSDAIDALEYAVANGAMISNNSWGGGGFSQTLFNAIQQAGEQGHIFVAAAGNSGVNNDSSPHYPSSYALDNVISVAATDHNDQLASFSNFGAESVDLAAPGVGILSTFPTYMTAEMQSAGFSTHYDTISGTSMATPHVAGAVALVKAQNPTFTASQVISQVLNNVDPLSSLTGKVATGGRLNAAAALGPDTSGPQVVDSSPSGSVNGSVSSVQVTFNKPIDPSSFTTSDIVSFTGPGGVNLANQITDVTGEGSSFTITFNSQSARGDYSLVFGPHIVDLAQTPNAMDQDGDGIAGETPDDRFTAAFTISAQSTFASTDVPLPINDLETTVSSLFISQDVIIGDLDVQLDITHSWDADLEVYLLRPGGSLQDSVSLVRQRGSFGDNFVDTIFDDEATVPISQGSAPFAGSFQPETPLSQYDGIDAGGEWQLWVHDGANLDPGTLNSWSLTMTRANAPPELQSNQPPVADAGGPYSADQGESTTLDASESLDGNGSIVLYQWDLNHDGQYDSDFDAVGATAAFSSPDPGVYTVGLRVTDDAGDVATDTATVTVSDSNQPPPGNTATSDFVEERVSFTRETNKLWDGRGGLTLYARNAPAAHSPVEVAIRTTDNDSAADNDDANELTQSSQPRNTSVADAPVLAATTPTTATNVRAIPPRAGLAAWMNHAMSAQDVWMQQRPAGLPSDALPNTSGQDAHEQTWIQALSEVLADLEPSWHDDLATEDDVGPVDELVDETALDTFFDQGNVDSLFDTWLDPMLTWR